MALLLNDILNRALSLDTTPIVAATPGQQLHCTCIANAFDVSSHQRAHLSCEWGFFIVEWGVPITGVLLQ